MKDINLPNFLIVGTAKAGTSSISKYLDEHPDVYIPEIKEPRYFLHDVFNEINKSDPIYDYLINSSVLNWDDYLDLYQEADSKVSMFGDASVQYLYHYDTVIPKIIEKLGDVHIIIILRNPVDRAFSNYKFQYRKQFLSFKDALEIEEDRKKDNFNSFWFYKDMGMYCKQVEAYKKAFSNVHVCLYDDLVKDTDTFMKNIYGFLNIKNITNNYEKKYNETTVPKNNILLYLNFIRNKYNFNFSFLPVKIKTKIKEITFQKNKAKIDFKTSQYLKNIFRDDIKCLEKLISRDLSRWY